MKMKTQPTEPLGFNKATPRGKLIAMRAYIKKKKKKTQKIA
jgi:hypothetical protein